VAVVAVYRGREHLYEQIVRTSSAVYYRNDRGGKEYMGRRFAYRVNGHALMADMDSKEYHTFFQDSPPDQEENSSVPHPE